MEAGADLVELDYRHSRDGELIVIHDDKLNRTTDAQEHWGRKHIRVDSKTAAEIQSLDAGSWFHPKFAGTTVPILTEALDVIQAARLRSSSTRLARPGHASSCCATEG